MDRGPHSVVLDVNGRHVDVAVDVRQTLLDVLRDDLGLTGAKHGCGMGNCGACTVLADGRPVYACLMLAMDSERIAIRTVEGLEGPDGKLHPVQQAFVDADAFQCGFCTPGQVLTVTALLDRTPQPDESAILRALSGNLCRCGAYPNLVHAVRLAAGLPSAASRTDAAGAGDAP